MNKNLFNFDLKFEDLIKYFLLVLTIFGLLFSLYFTFTNITEPASINIFLSLPFIFFLTPYLSMGLWQIKRVESKMGVIPRFLRDVVDNVESGMDLVTSIKTTTHNEYSVLNEDVEKLSNQLSWGVSFEKALLNFADNVGSDSLKRDFLLVVEARKVGGHVEKILRELSQKISIEILRKKERKSNLASNTFTGYISFVIFIFIIILVYNNLFLGLGNSIQGNQFDPTSDVNQAGNDRMSIYLSLLILLTYELAVLSGFLFGMMEENNIINGAPHVVILVIMTFIGFFFFVKI